MALIRTIFAASVLFWAGTVLGESPGGADGGNSSPNITIVELSPLAPTSDPVRGQALAKTIFQRVPVIQSAKATDARAASRDSRRQKNLEESGIPGAVIALIFGVFGLLVVGRRRAR